MKLIKWLSVSDRYAKAYLDEKLAPLGLTSSQHMYVLKICRTPGLTQGSAARPPIYTPQQRDPHHHLIGTQRFFDPPAL